MDVASDRGPLCRYPEATRRQKQNKQKKQTNYNYTLWYHTDRSHPSTPVILRARHTCLEYCHTVSSESSDFPGGHEGNRQSLISNSPGESRDRESESLMAAKEVQMSPWKPFFLFS